jgi:TPR repeat protein
MYANGRGVHQDYAEALNWYRKAAEHGNASGEYNFGYMYGAGQGVSPNYGEALKWFRKAADQGFADAQYGLGPSTGTVRARDRITRRRTNGTASRPCGFQRRKLNAATALSRTASGSQRR